MGGYAANRGNTLNVVVVNNTTYQGTGGEIQLQYNCNGITIKNNILYARTGQPYVSNSGGNNTNVTVDNNIYFGASGTSPGSYPDARARFVNPLLVAPYLDLHLLVGSPAIDAGINLGNDTQGHALSGDRDVDAEPRVQGSAVDIGADEFGVGAPLAVETPGRSQLALEGLRPNPATLELSVSFSLPQAGPATLTVLDVSGRELSVHEVGNLGPGPHVVRLDDRTGIPPGIYWLRLTQAGRSRVSRGAVLR
jgi:hypothetical protein